MSTIPRAGRWLKLDRSKEHLKTLERKLDAVLSDAGPTPMTSSCRFDPDDQSWVCRIDSFAPIKDTSLGTLIGEAVQNMRSALDYLIWDLAVLDGKDWPRDKKGRPARTQFPICERPNGEGGFESKQVQTKLLHNISPPHRTKIKSLQPYESGSDTLLKLARISNEDKHRMIQVVFTDAWGARANILGFTDCAPKSLGGPPLVPGPLEPGTEILRLPLTSIGPKPYVKVVFEVAFGVSFSNRESVSTTLAQIAQAVEEILTVFETELSTPQAQAIREAADAAHHG